MRRIAASLASGGFNPRAPTERDSSTGPSSCVWRCFNSRTPTERDGAASRMGSTTRRFNSRAPTERDSDDAPAPGAKSAFQFTRPYGARPAGRGLMDTPTIVSIHAPLRSATTSGAGPHKHCVVSIHAPLRSATTLLSKPRAQSFVSIHAPLRSATSQAWRDAFDSGVSIHAPLRSATPGAIVMVSPSTFQFTRPYGARPAATGRESSHARMFQFTRPYGARRP